MNTYFENYVSSLNPQNLATAVVATKESFSHKVLDNFDYCSDYQVLLYGDVQSGKTSHMLGIVAECLDQGFETIVILTSPNTRLVDQTYERIFRSLSGVQVCRSDMTMEFKLNRDRLKPMPCVVVMGKIPRILENWLTIFNEENSLGGNPILIVDDEADATSLNTQVNADDVSTINSQLSEMRKAATGCIYMQVTGTPQAVLLQTEESGWAARESVYFRPGDNYVGGKLFFEDLPNPHARVFSESDDDEQRNLRLATHTHMLTSAMFKIGGQELCNMIVHPSHKKDDHTDYVAAVKSIVDSTYESWDDPTTYDLLKRAYGQLHDTYREAPSFESAMTVLAKMHDEFNFMIINACNKTQESDWAKGYNFIVGGNSLGRGLTFDFLQTIFYVRESKRPQADTVWQHARMFGYKRHIPTLRWFLPAGLAKMFQEVHHGNEVIKMQLENSVNIADLRVSLGEGISPTRSNVLDSRYVCSLTGGVNYFAGDPKNVDFGGLDAKIMNLVDRFGDDFEIDARALNKLTYEFETDQADLDLATFRLTLEEMIKDNPGQTARIVVRTGRKVNHGKGTLLSPTDQLLSKDENDKPLMILYRIEGVNDAAQARGESTWSSDPIWVPNIRLPKNRVFWRVDPSRVKS